MTIRKGKPLPLEKPSNMRDVLQAVEMGNHYKREIVEYTGLPKAKVHSALLNLVHTGSLIRKTDSQRRSLYYVKGQWQEEVSDFIRCTSFIFDVKLVRTDLP